MHCISLNISHLRAFAKLLENKCKFNSCTLVIIVLSLYVQTKGLCNMLEKIKSISIREYLSGLGINPNNKSSYYGMYYAFWRGDTNPSVKVDYNRNLWVDYATNKGGSIVDLVMTIDNCSFADAVRNLSRDFTIDCTHKVTYSTKSTTTNAMQNLKDRKLSNKYLMEYLHSRKINSSVAKKFCREVHYTVGDKKYYGVGFKNDKGGWVIRSKYFKGCGSSYLTTIKGGKNCCTVIEGFMDFLSFVTMYGEPKGDAIVLNSTKNIGECIAKLSNYERIYLLLDNDTEGNRATKQIMDRHTRIAEDRRGLFAGFKDMNERLMGGGNYGTK